MTFNKLAKTIKESSPGADIEKIRQTFEFTSKIIQTYQTKLKEDNIKYSLEFTNILAQLNLDTATLQAALLQQTIKITKNFLPTIEKLFGSEVAKIVDGVYKINKFHIAENKNDHWNKNLYNLFLGIADDARVILIKLYDQLHMVLFDQLLSPEEKKRAAKHNMELFAPLANRLGMGELKGQLEDASFPLIYPEEYKWTKKIADLHQPKRKKYIDKIAKSLTKNLTKEGLKIIDIHGRIKHLYSLYRKLLRYDQNIDRIFDLVALRIIVNSIEDCYRALGFIHKKWKPLPGRIKDYIATPKANGYQSLHTTVISPGQEIIEIQIRTPKMHQEAELGIAAHWYYKEKEKFKKPLPLTKLRWIKQLAEWQKEFSLFASKENFIKSLKTEIFKKRIFVFTPKGDIIDLPDNATPIDFAYQIHTDVGHRCSEAQINGKLVSLDCRLKNGDVVNIILKEKIKPSRDWLEIAKTSLAKNRIRSWFKQQNRDKNLETGKELLNAELNRLKNKTISSIKKAKIKELLDKLSFNHLDELLVAIGQGDLSVNKVIKTLYKAEEIIPKTKQFIFFGKTVTRPQVRIVGEKNLLIHIAKCCNPLPNEPIKAYITKLKGATIHKADCLEIKFQKDTGRILDARWEMGSENYSRIKVLIKALNRLNLLKDIIDIISMMQINIVKIDTQYKKNDIVWNFITLEIKNLDQLVTLLKKTKKIKNIIEVKRI